MRQAAGTGARAGGRGAGGSEETGWTDGWIHTLCNGEMFKICVLEVSWSVAQNRSKLKNNGWMGQLMDGLGVGENALLADVVPSNR